MGKPDSGALLKQLIQEKEAQHIAEEKLLKEHFHKVYEGLKPVNIIKNTFNEIISAPDLKANVLNAAIGVATGFAAKKVFAGKSANPLTKFSGVVLEMLVAAMVAKNADGIKSMGSTILNKIFNRKPDQEEA